MKLSSILQTIEKAYPLLADFSASEVTINGAKYQQILNLQNVRTGLLMLKSLKIFDDKILQLENSFFFSINERKTNINHAEFQNVRNTLTELSIIVNGVRNALANVIPEEQENTVYIKMPDILNLEDFKKTVEAFNKILSLTILDPKIGGEIVFAGVEPGSNWYKVFVKTTTAVSLLGGLMWSGAVVYKKIQEGRLLEQIVREKELQNDHKANVVNAYKLITETIIEAEAENLYKIYYENGEMDNEQLERLKVSLKILAEEIGKGAEINPALTAPEEVSNLFPNMKHLPMVESRIKRIENK